MNMRTVILYAVLSVATALLVGCAREDDTAGGFSWIIEEGTGFPDVNPLKVEGDIQIAGSSTVFPLAEALASRFGDEGYGYNLTIDSIGSGAGFERFCVAGESDIANASRPIKDSEVESCDAVGREPIEIRIGTDALAIVVNPDNDWASNASVEELAELFTAELWSDVNSAWPNEPIERFIPGTDSGTFDILSRRFLTRIANLCSPRRIYNSLRMIMCWRAVSRGADFRLAFSGLPTTLAMRIRSRFWILMALRRIAPMSIITRIRLRDRSLITQASEYIKSRRESGYELLLTLELFA